MTDFELDSFSAHYACALANRHNDKIYDVMYTIRKTAENGMYATYMPDLDENQKEWLKSKGFEVIDREFGATVKWGHAAWDFDL